MFGNKKQGGGEPFGQKVARWMSGRNGPDELYRFLWWAWVAMFVLELIFSACGLRVLYAILFALSTAMIVWQIFRCFSRNVPARQRENARFLRLRGKVRGFFRLQKDQFRDRKTHVYRSCPACKNTLRLPRQKGEHTVQCPVCHHRFDLKI